LGAFVTRDRLGAGDWDGPTSRPTLIETIPRINKQDYYRNIYDHYISQYGQLPLEILGGGNEVAGGEIGDPRIVGPTKDDEYFRRIRTARLCIYHGDTPYHVHYHPIEFMAVGTPVLFHVDSALAEEARAFDLTEAELDGMGMYHNAEHARQKAAAALRDWRVAQAISEQQRFFMNVVFNRDRVLRQAIALKQHCTAQLRALRNGYPTNTEHQPPAPPNEKPVLSTTQKFAREIRRIGNQIRRRVAG
jgi:hypothetical protein